MVSSDSSPSVGLQHGFRFSNGWGGGELKKYIVLHGHFGAPLWLYGETSVNGNRLNANEVVGKQQSVKKINCYLSGQSDVIFLC